jgi:hypothetical protein
VAIRDESLISRGSEDFDQRHLRWNSCSRLGLVTFLEERTAGRFRGIASIGSPISIPTHSTNDVHNRSALRDLSHGQVVLPAPNSSHYESKLTSPTLSTVHREAETAIGVDGLFTGIASGNAGAVKCVQCFRGYCAPMSYKRVHITKNVCRHLERRTTAIQFSVQDVGR